MPNTTPVAPLPSLEDTLPRLDTDPPDWHVRETTDDGYPLMGSSPAERADSVERLERIRKDSEITDHPFSGDGPYCQAMLDRGSIGGPATTGVIRMSSQCGYTNDLHVPAGEVAW
jgi:hypothetical protein